jgi:hypothetical protein
VEDDAVGSTSWLPQMNRRKASTLIATALTAAGAAILTVAKGGHEIPVYPSYYPHEIELAAVTQERASELLPAGKIHAYVGAAPRFTETPPASIDSIESLGSFVIIRINPLSPRARDEQSVCAISDSVIRDLAGKSPAFTLHPYPVTPFHGDYLEHVDLAEAAKARILGGRADLPASAPADLKVKADSDFARALVRPAWRAHGAEWDVEITQVGAAELVSGVATATNGWLGPARLKTGWFHAYLLLGKHAANGDARQRVEAQVRRLESSNYDTPVERINLARSLVTTLVASCRVRVAGYTAKREYFITTFAAGIENIGYDSITGFNSPTFVRTVKLRDFPWNGWLALGIDAAPAAAWNPIAGFTDDFGRLMWSAVGDPASIPSPYDGTWMFNRVSGVQSSAKQ